MTAFGPNRQFAATQHHACCGRRSGLSSALPRMTRLGLPRCVRRPLHDFHRNGEPFAARTHKSYRDRRSKRIKTVLPYSELSAMRLGGTFLTGVE
jgi:hypothetical protein